MTYRVAYVGGTHTGMRESREKLPKEMKKKARYHTIPSRRRPLPEETYHLVRVKINKVNRYLYVHSAFLEGLKNEQ